MQQMDAAWVNAQPEEVVRGVLARALDDLRLARDRINQSPGNSSRPSGSMPPWKRTAIAQAVHQELDEAPRASAKKADNKLL